MFYRSFKIMRLRFSLFPLFCSTLVHIYIYIKKCHFFHFCRGVRHYQWVHLLATVTHTAWGWNSGGWAVHDADAKWSHDQQHSILVLTWVSSQRVQIQSISWLYLALASIWLSFHHILQIALMENQHPPSFILNMPEGCDWRSTISRKTVNEIISSSLLIRINLMKIISTNILEHIELMKIISTYILVYMK